MVFYKHQDETYKWKWYVGMVITLPAENRVYFDIQPYGSSKLTKTRKNTVEESQFIPIWIDPKDDKEVWSKTIPKRCHTFLMQVEPNEVIITGFDLTDWHITEDVLIWLQKKGLHKIRPIQKRYRR